MSEDNQYTVETGTFMLNPHGEWYLPSVNGSTFHRTNSKSVFDNNFAGVLSEEDTLYIIVGTDSGLLIDYVIAQPPAAGSRYIFIEFPEVIDALRKHAPERFERLPEEKVAVRTPDRYQELYEAFGFQNYFFAQRVKVISSLAALNNSLLGYSRLKTSIWNETDYQRWELVGPLNSKPFYRRAIDNVAENILPAVGLVDMFKNKTALIAAGGPSLDTLIPWIKDNRNRFTLIAVSRISRRLIQAGITPDVIVTIDPHPVSFYVSSDIFQFANESLFVHSGTANKQLTTQWPGRHLYIGNRLNWPNRLDVENISVNGPTVTNSAVTLAIMWGYSRILLAGVDLCFDAQGYTHASGSMEHDRGPMLTELGYQTNTNDGGIAETNAAYRSAADMISQQTTLARDHDAEIINLAATASRMEGVRYCPPEELDLPDDGIPSKQPIELLPTVDRELRIAHYSSVLQYFDELKHDVDAIIGLSEEALEANEKLYDKNGKMANPAQKRRMDRIEQKLNTDLTISARLVQAFGMIKFAEVLRGDDRDWTETELKAWANDYYTIYRDSGTELLNDIKSGIKRLAMRLEEESATPDYDALAEYWEEDETPGRINVIERLRPDTFPSDKVTAFSKFVHLKQRFEASLHEPLMPTEEEQRQQLKDILASARMLYWERNEVRLQRMLDHFPPDDSNDAKNLKHLIRGYIHELRGEPDQAIEQYQQQEIALGLEDGLVQLSILLLDRGDADNAGAVLQCLTQISPSYIPQYANLLRLTGRPREALDQYATYFQFAPKDIHTMHILASLYQELEAPDAVCMMYRYILEVDPENNAALRGIQILGCDS